ncbi:MAG TPA: glycoside hydrolase family 31 protein, partial [Bacteroidota bacterium]
MKRLIFLLLLSYSVLSAQWKSIGNVDSVEVGRNSVTLFSGPSRVMIQVLAEDVVHVRLAPGGTFRDHVSPAVINSMSPEQSPKITQAGELVEIRTGKGIVIARKYPLRLQFLDNDGSVINQDDPSKGMAWDGVEVRVWKDMPFDEQYFGFGEKAGRLNKKWTHMTMWNSDIPAYRADTDPLYESIPFFYAIRGGRTHGMFFDNSYRSSFDMGKSSEHMYSFGASGGELNYYFFFGPTPQSVLKRFTDLIGRMPLPPLWSLGYQQCRWSYYPESRVREIANNFRKRNIPADVLYLDIHYMDEYRIFTWDNERFPNPRKLVSDLGSMGFKVAVILDPGIKEDPDYHAYQSGLAGDHFLKNPDGTVYIGNVWPGPCAFPDFSSSGARTWWGEQLKLLSDLGIRGWWNDMNEPAVFTEETKTVPLEVLHYDEGRLTPHEKNHNLYGMQMTQATYEGVRRLLPNERPFVLTRASFAGGHRYSAAWTGDNIASWEHLQMSVPMCLNLSISGQPFVGPDIGGFFGNPSGELFARWLQLGVFMPLMRGHSVIDAGNKEPWEYGKEFERINRETIELRYRLLPHIYNQMWIASETGIPPMRPLIFQYSDDPDIAGRESSVQNAAMEFMFGEDILVAPVLWEGEKTRSLRLPEGVWYDYWTGTKYPGGRNVTVPAPINRIPFLVREGAVIPTQPDMQFVGEKPLDPLTLTIYPASRSIRMYYEDDGVSFEYRKGSFMKRTIRQDLTDAVQSILVSAAEGTYEPAPRSVIIQLISPRTDGKKPSNVMVGSEHLPRAQPSAATGWWFDEATKSTNVKIKDGREEIRIVVE